MWCCQTVPNRFILDVIAAVARLGGLVRSHMIIEVKIQAIWRVSAPSSPSRRLPAVLSSPLGGGAVGRNLQNRLQQVVDGRVAANGKVRPAQKGLGGGYQWPKAGCAAVLEAHLL